MNRRTLITFLLVMAAIFAISTILPSCTTQKKATNYFLIHRDQLAGICSEQFPSTPGYVIGRDTLVSTQYDTVYSAVPVYDKGDTIVIGHEKVRTIYVNKYHVRTDTITKVDNAKISQLQTQLSKAQATANTNADTIADYKSDAHKKIAWIIGLALVLVVSIYINIKCVSFKTLLSLI